MKYNLKDLTLFDIPWLAQAYSVLSHQYISDRPPVSLIISGAVGVGKHLLAYEVIKHLLCLAPEQVRACQVCQSCLWMAQYHPDFLSIGLEDDAKVIRVEQIRAVSDFVQKTSETGKKIVCIQNAELMNIHAANSLLKNLEEPPAHVYFILIVENVAQLPITITSRCQNFHVQIPRQTEAKEWLCASIPDPKIVDTLLAISGNAPLLALSYYKNENMKEVHALEEGMLEFFAAELGVSKLAGQISRMLPLALNCLYSWLCMAVKYQYTDQNTECISYSPVIAQLVTISVPDLLDCIAELTQVIQYQGTQLRLDWILESWLAKLNAMRS